MSARRAALTGVRTALAALALTLTAPAAVFGAQDAPRIADNSFLVEEAYNQESGVVQHINTLWASGPGRRALLYALTQEWPVRGQRHQLSYTIPVNLGDGRGAGLGDLMVNYRLQLELGRDVVAAPRLSLAMPTGDWDRGFGTGSPGVQLAVPMSARVSRQVVLHANGGVTVSPSVRAPGGIRRAVTGWSAAGSVVGPVLLPVNLLLETLVLSDAGVSATGAIERSLDVIVSPGVRFAFELGRMQVVPGFAVPLYLRRGIQRHDLFVYLSLEHAFRGARAAEGAMAR